MSDEPGDTVVVTVDGSSVSCRRGRPLLNELQNAGIVVETACGGQGTCFLCRVTVKDGAEKLPSPTAAEKRGLGNVLLAMNMRLSCQITAGEGLAIEVPRRETPQQRRARIRRAREQRAHKKGKS